MAWQDELEKYKTNAKAAELEIQRAKSVYESKKASGDTAGAKAASDWANQIRGVQSSVSKATDPIKTVASPYTTTSTTNADGSFSGGGTRNLGSKTVDASGNTTTNISAQPVLAAKATEVSPAEQYRQFLESQAKSSYETALNNKLKSIEQGKTELDPYYSKQRTAAKVSNEMSAKSMKDFLASRGLSNSGSAPQGEMMSNYALAGQLGGINQAQMKAFADLDLQAQQAKQDYETQISNFTAQQEMDRLTKLQADQEAKNALALSQEANNATNLFNNQIATVGNYSNDFQAEINRRMAANPADPLIPYLVQARNDKLQGIATQEATAQKQALAQQQAQLDQQALMNKQMQQQIDNAFEMMKTIGYATPEIASILGIKIGTKTADYIDMLTDNSRLGASSSGSSAKNPLAQKTSTNTSLSSLDTKIYNNFVDETKGTVDKYGIAEYVKNLWNTGVLGSTEEDAALVLALLQKYGADTTSQDFADVTNEAILKAQELPQNTAQVIR